jgi:hypothetical protein
MASGRIPVFRGCFRGVRELTWPLDQLALCVYRFLLRFCLSWWLIDRREKQMGREAGAWDLRRAGYVMFWVVVLVVMWAINPTDDLFRKAFVGIAAWRWLEVFTTGLGVVLDRGAQVRARSLITLAIYGLQITLVFAILDHSLAASSDFITSDGIRATGAFDYLYVSWTDMTTIGNAYIPHSVAARALKMATTTSGILLLGILVAFGINEVKRRVSESLPGGSP